MRSLHWCSPLVVALLLTGPTGCFRYAISSGGGGNLQSTPSVTYESHFLWGLIAVGESPKVSMTCGAPDASVIVQRDFVESLLGIATLGIWTPSTMSLYCGPPSNPVSFLSPSDQPLWSRAGAP